MKKILVAGATGLIGNTVLNELLKRSDLKPIAITRRALPIADQNLDQWISSGDDLTSALKNERVDAVICCLGTTIRNAGSQAAFRHVDHDLVIAIGEWAKKNDVRTFCVVSAIGADAGSSIFYNKVKGEMERDLKELQLPVLHIFHPSILTGPRKETRVGEKLGIAVTSLIAPLLIGKLKRYRPMPHDVLAKALINAASIERSGTYTFAEIKRLAAVQNVARRP